MVEVARLDIVIRSDQAKRGTDEVKRGLDQAGEAGERASNKISGAFDRLKNSIFSVQGAVTTLAGAFTFYNAIQMIAQFERTMSTVRAVTSASQSDLQKLTETARELGATTMFSATEAAEGMKLLGQAGFNTQQILSTIGPTLRLAQAGAIELAEAADIASNAITTFNLRAEELQRVGDVMALVANRTNSGIRDMAEAIKYAGPVAASVGRTFEETAAAIGVLGNAGLQGSLAGTGLRQAMLALVSPTGNAKAAIEEMGLTVGQLNPTTNSLVSIMQRLKDANISAAQASQIFGDRAAGAVLVLTQNVETLKTMNTEVLNAQGNLDEMARIMEDNLYGSLKNLESAYEELILATGDRGFTGALKSGISFLTDFIRALSGSLDTTQQGAQAMYAFRDAVMVLAGAFAGLALGKVTAGLVMFASETYKAVVAIRAATAAQTGLNLVMLANPIVLVATAIGAVAAAMLIFGDNTRRAQEAQDQYNKAVRSSEGALATYRTSIAQTNEELTRLSQTQAAAARVEVDKALVAQQEQIRGIVDEVTNMYDATRNLTSGTAAALRAFTEPWNAIQESIARADMERLAEQGKVAEAQFLNLFIAFRNGQSNIDQLIAGLDQIARSNASIAPEVAKVRDRVVEQRTAYNDATSAAERLRREQEILTAIVQGLPVPLQQTADGTQNVGTQSRLTADALAIMKQQMIAAANASVELANTMNSLAGSISNFHTRAQEAQMSNMERQIAAVNREADELIRQARESGMVTEEAIAQIEADRQRLISAIRNPPRSSSPTAISDVERTTTQLREQLTVMQQTDELSRKIVQNLLSAGLNPNDRTSRAAQDIVRITTEMYNLEQATRVATDQQTDFQRRLAEATGNTEALRREMEYARQQYEAGNITREQFLAIERSINAELNKGTEETRTRAQALRESLDVYVAYTEKMKEYEALLRQGAITQEEFNRLKQTEHPLYAESQKLIESQMTSQERYNQEFQKYQTMLDAGLISQEQFNRAIVDLGQKYSETAQTMKRLGEGLAEAFADAFEGMIVDGKSFQEVLGDMAKAVQRLVIELLVLEPLKKALGGMFSSIGSGTGGSFFSNLFKFHDGGIVGENDNFKTMSGAQAAAAEMLKKGLKAYEQLSVLKKGEEVLTEDDPRHSRNIMGAANDNYNIDLQKKVVGLENFLEASARASFKRNEDTTNGAITSFLAGLPRYHNGGVVGGASYSSGISANVQRDMAASNRSTAANTGVPVTVQMNIQTPDAQGFRKSQGQIAAETAAAIQRASRYQ